MTQEQLAQKCGVTRQTIIALEQERYNPSLELAFKITNALGKKRIEDVFKKNIKDLELLDDLKSIKKAELEFKKGKTISEKKFIAKAIKIELNKVKSGSIKTKSFNEMKKKFKW